MNVGGKASPKEDNHQLYLYCKTCIVSQGSDTSLSYEFPPSLSISPSCPANLVSGAERCAQALQHHDMHPIPPTTQKVQEQEYAARKRCSTSVNSTKDNEQTWRNGER